MPVPISLHRDLLPRVPQLLKSLMKGAFTSHTKIFHTAVCLSVSTSGSSLTSFQTSLLANLFDLWWDQLPAVLELFPKAQGAVLPTSLLWLIPVITHSRQRQLTLCVYLTWTGDVKAPHCKKALNISYWGNRVKDTSLAWYPQEHRGVCTCKTSKRLDLPGFDGIIKGFLY